jgi:8-oxo-dGTP pyrophosphatase MutT (NUDIX family)
MHNQKLVAKAVVLNPAGQVLVLRRSQTDRIRPGGMDFPGGSVEPSESYRQAVIREIAEETGIQVEKPDVSLGFTATTFYEGSSTIRFLFVTKVADDTPVTLSFEHDKHEWLDIEAVVKAFDHPVWGQGLSYLKEHNLLG